ncbi:hypothetical protein CEXT_356561 [Caerostris extrusa]|uniref:Uncharacterized protein n=1 Tax=Caerostris extrusa TaxID=172846 RepID=A0AAV4XEV9_CAEEX|nr:hypothetical protein CEXT_356561 [Caerostris extrusa]
MLQHSVESEAGLLQLAKHEPAELIMLGQVALRRRNYGMATAPLAFWKITIIRARGVGDEGINPSNATPGSVGS